MKKDILQTLINEKMEKEGLSFREAAKQVGVSHSTFIEIARGGSVPNIESLVLISNWLNVSPSTLIDARAQGEVGLYAKVAAFLEYHPYLKPVFEEAFNRLEKGKLSPSTINDLIAYSMYRIDLEDKKSAE